MDAKIFFSFKQHNKSDNQFHPSDKKQYFLKEGGGWVSRDFILFYFILFFVVGGREGGLHDCWMKGKNY